MIHVFEDAYISVSGTVLQATKITVEDGNEEISAKRMGDTAGNSIPGIAKQSITATFLQDFSAGDVHATLRAALLATRAGNTVAVVVRPDSGAKSATNPEWSGDMKLFETKPIDASAGDKSDCVAVFKTSGTALAYSEGA
jgi:hypothetical protein